MYFIASPLMRNFGETYKDATNQLKDLLSPNRYAFTYGIFYPEEDECIFEAKHIVFIGCEKNEYPFEQDSLWWVNQIKALADFYLRSQFDRGVIDYQYYRTSLALSGSKTKDRRQETGTISRLVYGFSTAYMVTGDERFLEAAEKGSVYLREHMRFLDTDEEVVYWYHGIDFIDGREHKIFASEFEDDYYSLPAYEQIYALTGLVQTYRVTGDPSILEDVEATIRLFDKFYLDKVGEGGYFSHIDPITLDPHSELLQKNRARKNWNSIGDHAPAYLINIWLATNEDKYVEMLEHLFDTIKTHFPDQSQSPFVQERFHKDWSPDTSWGWQKNRAVIGHNLKIAWNLMRMYHLKPKGSYVQLAQDIAESMPKVASDQQRGGWYDVVERISSVDGNKKFTWHDRKAWWQQEQAILAYLILAGSLKKENYLRLARESAAFYNTWFLDHEDGGVYFNVLANGLPYLLQTERSKGSHSMSGYHAFELAYLAGIYTNLMITKKTVELYFKPVPSGFKGNILRVQPDLLPKDCVYIGCCWINGKAYSDFNSNALTVNLPITKERITVKVKLVPK